MKLVTLCAASLAALCAAAPALAETEIRSQAVDFSRSELASESGREAIETRIAAAAREVCNAPGKTDAEVRRLELECQRRAIAEARAKLDARSAVVTAALSAGGAQ
ncbi:UrcA family protein [Marinicauda algicola]|nr:UrcA family protein [Marinicauda algicola]